MKLLLLFVFLVPIPVNFSDTDPSLLKEQKMIVAQLCGHEMLPDGALLSYRSTKRERKIAREYLYETLSSTGLETNYQHYTMPNVNPFIDLLIGPFRGANVYCTLPSTIQSDEYVIIGAHYDSERNCPGAIDNATGVAITYGALKQLAKLKERNVNVILIYFDQEEENLIGSQAFAMKLKKEKYNIHSVHTLDAMGWDRDKDRAVELTLPTPYLKDLYSTVGKKLNIPIYTSQLSASDHHAFRLLGFKATGLTDGISNGDYTPFGDTPKDTYETVNFDYVSSCTELLFQVVKEILQ